MVIKRSTIIGKSNTINKKTFWASINMFRKRKMKFKHKMMIIIKNKNKMKNFRKTKKSS